MQVTDFYSEFKILPQLGAKELCRREPFKWNIVSIYSPGPNILPPNLLGAESITQHSFHDAEEIEEGAVLCNEYNIIDILYFSKTHTGQPLAIHCMAGISRSTATAILIILNQIKDKVDNPIEEAIKMIYSINRFMLPNHHVLKLGIKIIANNLEIEEKWLKYLEESETMQEVNSRYITI